MPSQFHELDSVLLQQLEVLHTVDAEISEFPFNVIEVTHEANSILLKETEVGHEVSAEIYDFMLIDLPHEVDAVLYVVRKINNLVDAFFVDISERTLTQAVDSVLAGAIVVPHLVDAFISIPFSGAIYEIDALLLGINLIEHSVDTRLIEIGTENVSYQVDSYVGPEPSDLITNILGEVPSGEYTNVTIEINEGVSLFVGSSGVLMPSISAFLHGTFMPIYSFYLGCYINGSEQFWTNEDDNWGTIEEAEADLAAGYVDGIQHIYYPALSYMNGVAHQNSTGNVLAYIVMSANLMHVPTKDGGINSQANIANDFGPHQNHIRLVNLPQWIEGPSK